MKKTIFTVILLVIAFIFVGCVGGECEECEICETCETCEICETCETCEVCETCPKDNENCTESVCNELYPHEECPEPEITKEKCDELYPPITCPTPDVELPLVLGIDRVEQYKSLFADNGVGLITNQTGLNSNYVSSIDVLYETVNLVALYAPEHGIRGNAQAGGTIGNEIDEKTKLPVYSLYGQTKKPTPAMLAGVDILCFDIQDVGARFYTYIYTMAYAMQACQENNIKFVVFDRPNPVSGDVVEGNILDMKYSSFIGMYPIVQRHGMTVGELAMYFNAEFGINCDLQVIRMQNWDRTKYYDDSSLPWVTPSPNMPSVKCAVVYTGTCIFEGTNVSEGRGTTIPFEQIGAPFINPFELADSLNELNLPGVYFRPTYFTPTFSKFQGVQCAGVQVHVTDRATFNSVYTGWAMFKTVRTMYPNDFVINNAAREGCTVDLNTGCRYITNDTYSLAELKNIIIRDTNQFKATRSKYLLY